MENNKSYYAIIPANVRYDKKIIPSAKLLYGEITALCNEKGFCWATNEYFAKLYNVSKTTISKWINQLKKYEYINIEMNYKQGSKQILNRYIRIVKEGIKEKLNTPIKEKLKENNTMINITMNNIYSDLLKYWNNKNIIIHNKDIVLKHIKKKHKEEIELYGIDQVKKAIDNYNIVLKDNKYYWSYKWTFLDFIIRGLSKFVDECKPLENYLKNNKKEINENEYLQKKAVRESKELDKIFERV